MTTNSALLKFITSLLHSNFVKKIEGVFFKFFFSNLTKDFRWRCFMGFEFEFLATILI